jgi:antitoxin YefM
MKTIPLSAAKAEFSRLIDEISKTHTSYQITRGGVPEGVLMSSEEYESMLETLEILADPDLMRQIHQSIREMNKGKLLTHEEVFG